MRFASSMENVHGLGCTKIGRLVALHFEVIKATSGLANAAAL